MADLKLKLPGRKNQDFKDYKYSHKKSKVQINGHIFYICSFILYYVDVLYFGVVRILYFGADIIISWCANLIKSCSIFEGVQ